MAGIQVKFIALVELCDNVVRARVSTKRGVEEIPLFRKNANSYVCEVEIGDDILKCLTKKLGNVVREVPQV
jgi:hypothetical protein